MNEFRFNLIKLLALFLLIFNYPSIYGQKSLLNQKVGLYQHLPTKQLPVGEIAMLQLEFDKVPLKKLKKIQIYRDLIYLLDWEREEIYVIDKTGKYIRSIGGSGLGPGDLQKPVDFFISNDEKIYVLNPQTRRIESFGLDGEKLESVRLKLPLESSFPSAILFDDNTFYIGSSLNELISTYDCHGKPVTTILNRKVPLRFPGRHLVFDAKLAFLSKNKRILIFDDFRGIFCSVNRDGTLPVRFSNYMEKQDVYVKKTKETIGKSKMKVKPYMSTLKISLWSNFCLDENENIFTVPLVEEWNDYHFLVAFSSNGAFLYKKILKHKHLYRQNFIGISCDREMFLFVTTNFDFITCKRRITK